MLIKATYAETMESRGVENLYRFFISQDDLDLLGISSMRSWDPKAKLVVPTSLKQEKATELKDVNKFGFVARIPFKPDAFPESMPFCGQLPTMRKGDSYWVLINGPFRTPETYTFKIGVCAAKVSVYDCGGVYSCMDSDAILDCLMELDTMPVANYRYAPFPTMEKDLMEQFKKYPRSKDMHSRGCADWWFRTWGCIFDPFITDGLLKDGVARYGKLASGEPDFKALYSAFSKTVSEVGNANTFVGSPLFKIISDLSDPTEYGTFGCLLPAAMMLHPYAFIGPCSSPGLSSGGSSGTTKLLPYWLIDMYVKLAYNLNPDDEKRAMGIVYEAIRHLEMRNHQAFTKYTGSKPHWNDGFNFDKDGPIPAGSTLFSPGVIQSATLCRRTELELSRSGILNQVFIGDEYYPNIYRALAGYLNMTIDPVLVSDASRLNRAVKAVTLAAPYVDSSGNFKKWYTLKSRGVVAMGLIDLLFNQNLDPDKQIPLKVNPPITEAIPNSTQKPVNLSQANASQTIIRWRISCVTGGPGVGKTFFTNEFERYARELTLGGDTTTFLFLGPTNQSVEKAASELRDCQPYLFGTVNADGDMPDFHVALGTMDSFLGTMQVNGAFRDKILNTNCILAMDESSMNTPEKCKDILDLFTELGNSNLLSPRLLRLVFVGDNDQLEPIEPGSLFGDFLKVLLVSVLKQQMRYTSTANDSRLTLEQLFEEIRNGMTNSVNRIEVVKKLVAVSKNSAIASNLKVFLLDDIPTEQPPDVDSDIFWNKFLFQLDKTVQRVILSEIMDVNSVQMDGTPRIKKFASQDDRVKAVNGYQTFKNAVTKPVLPFRILTLVRKIRSYSGSTEYISSADRINYMIHDALMGRSPQEFGYTGFRKPGELIRNIGNPKITITKKGETKIVNYEEYVDSIKDNPMMLWEFLSKHRLPTITLGADWNYVLLRNFKKLGVYKGDIIQFKSIRAKDGENHYVFVTKHGKELVFPYTYCNFKYMNYGWATNVHQIQGGESPLVIMVWLDGICPSMIKANWNKLKVEHEHELYQPFDPFTFGGMSIGGELSALDDKLDIKAFYTSATRTSLKKSSSNVQSGLTQSNTAIPQGRCVIITGKHALRRLLHLQVYPRVTPFFGLVSEHLNQMETQAEANVSSLVSVT